MKEVLQLRIDERSQIPACRLVIIILSNPLLMIIIRPSNRVENSSLAARSSRRRPSRSLPLSRRVQASSCLGGHRGWADGPRLGLDYTNLKQVTNDSISFEAQNVHRKLHTRQIADTVTINFTAPPMRKAWYFLSRAENMR
ncbi:hypothetical protein P692DRAFT_20827245, partial [Suillus brevipes Sb2]